MQRIATMTVIRGKGECTAIMNGIVNQEIRRQQAQIRAAVAARNEEARTVLESRNRLLGEKLDADRRTIYRRKGVIRGILDRLDTAWALSYATALAILGAVVDAGLRLGLWVREDENDGRAPIRQGGDEK